MWGIANRSEHVHSNVVSVGKRVCENLTNYYDSICYHAIQTHSTSVGSLNSKSLVYHAHAIDLGY